MVIGLWCSSWASAAATALALVSVVRAAKPIEEDPNSRYVCRGSLSEHAACQCKENEGELACVNAQFVDTEIFLNLNNHYKDLRAVTFHGNNFQDLPDGSLFGENAQDSLITLNISANYIVNLNSNALRGMSRLRVLDLSNNEIVLKDDDVDFLTHTPRLEELYLRRAFTATINRTVQFDLMMKMFYRGKLSSLRVLDLSYNFLHAVPYDIGCPFPALNVLDLRQNFLSTLAVNTSCLQNVELLDLSRNYFNDIDRDFRVRVAEKLHPNSLSLRNSFFCDCKSADWIQWVRTTRVLRDKNTLVCARASPESFMGARLIEVPVQQLDCETSLTANSGERLLTLLSLLLPLLLLLRR